MSWNVTVTGKDYPAARAALVDELAKYTPAISPQVQNAVMNSFDTIQSAFPVTGGAMKVASHGHIDDGGGSFHIEVSTHEPPRAHTPAPAP